MTDKPRATARKPSHEGAPLAPGADAVAQFLHANPDFFVGREELLADLRIPHRRGDTVSLVEHQLKLLRERNTELRQRMAQLMDVARDNDRLFDKTRRLILALLDATSLEEVVMSVDDSLRQDFKVPFVSLILFSELPTPVGRSVPLAEAQQAIGGLLNEGKPVSGSLRPHELAFLFGEKPATEIGSTALAPLSHQGLHGVLAIGSADPNHYKSSVGTLFLNYIAEVLGRVLPHFTHTLRSVR
ncbi:MULTISPECIES: DUF484 family protein [unclassified Pseudomonas]|uniref:DUF484 family protein n=1 Tax=unclassified Pseudomonas TaxID=196821 RepID=UPI000BD61FF4|nr:MULTISPECIES: DUF484 family protein [unclassified Pseudomonas]PVZ10428.1 hypothetical protein F474_04018 [Pseudomonas sp. URIL14HWK12:I12]PVZ21854.1 hypothetical protein F470_04018 [Pseudomonas sp. URIL14HWK12:I10]PVZ31063.1 hypothetical protein F472_04080 [Pseudomonas sp. URIL14HWK12:I11]SNZ17678.1 hypothetical protein SAMN05660463_03719 [Pseudomonas sp. URIL14HWK12:I9]